MFTIPSNYSFDKPDSGDIMIKGMFAIKLPDGTFEYDNGTGATALYRTDREKSNVSDGINYVSFFKSKPTAAGMAISFETKPTAKPELYIDLNTTKYSNNQRPSLAISGYIDTSKDSDAPILMMSYSDGILAFEDTQTSMGGSNLLQIVHSEAGWDLSKDQGPNGLIAKLSELGVFFDQEAYDSEGEMLFKFPPESYELLGNGSINLKRGAIPDEFFDRVKFKLYACPLEKILD